MSAGFAALMGQIIISALLLQTSSKYPPYPASLSDNPTLIAGCALIIACALVQVSFLASGINLSNSRILFESTSFVSVDCACNISAFLLLSWFALSLWVSSYILYIWGFLCIYPILNDIVGLIGVRYTAGRFHKFVIE